MVEFSAENKVYRVICMPQTLGELFPKLTPWGILLLSCTWNHIIVQPFQCVWELCLSYCFLICLFLRITANRSVENTADAIKYAKLWESLKNVLPTRTHPRSTSNKIDNFEHRRQSHHGVEHGDCALWNFKLIILLIFTSFQPFGLFLDLVKCRRNATGHICDLLCRLEPFWGSNTFIV